MAITPDVDTKATFDKPHAITRFGKPIFIKPHRGQLFSIVVGGGGIQPPEFDGLWNWVSANTAVASYIESGKGKDVPSVAAELGVTETALKAVLDAPEQPASKPADKSPAIPPETPHNKRKTLTINRNK